MARCLEERAEKTLTLLPPSPRRKGGRPPGESDDEGGVNPRASTPPTTTATLGTATTPASAAAAARAPAPASPPPSSACSDSEASESACPSLDGWAASVLSAAPPPAGEPPQGPPLFEWSEAAPPHERPPLTDRVRGLALGGWGGGGACGKGVAPPSSGASLLLTATSADLHPASWFAVAWYPLYTLPTATGRAARDLGGAFLTLHSLAPPPGGRACAAGCACASHAPATSAAPAARPGQPSPPDLGPIASAVAEGRRAAAAAAAPGQGGAVLLPAWGLATYKVPAAPPSPASPPGAPLPLGGPWADPAGEATVAAMRAAAVAWVDRRRAPAADLSFFASRAPRA
jgi:hypothetical protein